MNDKDIIKGLRAKKEKYYQSLVLKYSRYVAAIVTKVAGDRLSSSDVEEVCSDVFIKLWTNSKKIEVFGEDLKGYIGVVARNMTLNAIRKNNKVLEVALEEETIVYSSAEDSYFAREEGEILKQIINTMEEIDREIFIRRYFYLEKVNDIAKRLKMNEKAVSARIARGKQKLQILIDERSDVYEKEGSRYNESFRLLHIGNCEHNGR